MMLAWVTWLHLCGVRFREQACLREEVSSWPCGGRSPCPLLENRVGRVQLERGAKQMR